MVRARRTSNWKEESIATFKAELSMSKSARTVEAYCSDVSIFHEYLDKRGVGWASKLKSHHVQEFLRCSREFGKSSSTVSRYYMALKSYCRHLYKTMFVHVNFEEVTAPKYTQRTPKVPSEGEIERILQVPDISTEAGTRDLAILELLYSSGLRASELCNLRIEDYAGISVTVREGKRGKTRTIPTTESAQKAIDLYIQDYRGNEAGWLFVTLQDKQIRRQLLGNIVGDYARKAGVEKITPHSLRHACATHLLNNNADLLLIKEILGHASVASTQRYTHLSSARMHDMFHKFHPRKGNNE